MNDDELDRLRLRERRLMDYILRTDRDVQRAFRQEAEKGQRIFRDTCLRIQGRASGILRDSEREEWERENAADHD